MLYNRIKGGSYMKKCLYIFASMVLSSFLLIGCGTSIKCNSADWKPTTHETVNNFSGVSMNIKKGTVSTKGLTIEIENKSDKECTYGADFWLEKKINGKWCQVPVIIKGDYALADISNRVDPGKNSEWKAYWESLYGNIDKGDYRILKEVSDFRKPGDYDEYYLTSEFTI